MKFKNTGIALISIILASTSIKSNAQSSYIINSGANIIVGSNAYVIGNNYDNESNGTIDLSGGNIILNGNWINNANNNVFIKNNADGLVKLADTLANPQTIGGTNPTYFENLELVGSNKILKVNNIHVRGSLTIDALLDLNKKRIVLDTNNASALIYKSKCIKSETSDTLGEFQWNIGSTTDAFTVPFGSNTDADHNVILKPSSPGSSSQSVIFATYPTNPDNIPLPQGVGQQYTKADREADRFWEVYSPNISSSNFDLTLNYSPTDITNNSKIVESKLQIVSYNTKSSSSNPWKDMKPAGKDVSGSVVATALNADLAKNKYWAVVDAQFKYFIPNVITPNNDGHNDFFGMIIPDDETQFTEFDNQNIGIDGDIKNIDAKVFDRWGKVMKSWSGAGDDQQAFSGKRTGNYVGGTWDGKNKGGNIVSDGTYFYTLDVTDDTDQMHHFNGTVTVVSSNK